MDTMVPQQPDSWTEARRESFYVGFDIGSESVHAIALRGDGRLAYAPDSIKIGREHV